MSKSDALIENVNKVIYTELEKVLRSMNKRYYFSMYMVHLEKGMTCKEVKRIKKTVSGNKHDEFEVMQENMLSVESVLRELYLASFQNTEGKQFVDELRQAIDQQLYQVPIVEQSEPMLAFDNDEMQLFQPSKSEAGRVSEYRNLYSNNIDIRIGKVKHTLVYILEIVNLDENTRSLFYDTPQLSFLRMVLDYFFVDYFTDLDSLKSITEGQIEKRYNEDSTQFIRRVTRLFFGKIHGFIRESGHRLGEGKDMFVNKTANEYYVSNLMESIDDISTHTYEGSSPFGSILFIDTRIMSKGLDLIKFAIKFKEEDRIQLNDSKRIRKLVELTNEERDLYLIADHQSIYGLGEVRWEHLGFDELFRVDFKGLSKYNLVLVNTENQTPQNDGTIVHHADEKTYQVTRDIKIQDKNLVSVSFKTPNLGEAGYILEKFKKMIIHQFYKSTMITDKQEEQIDRLVKVVGKAREQKHGTMVVITKKTTAEYELSTLKKQSTLIEPIEINPNYIKYLTSIDGAIYFDETGVCHGIGVILDGLAHENVGDSSRGARYNSAHRYFHKLKADNKKCVIAIISEDGMVDLIPEDSEEKIHFLVREILDFISQYKQEGHVDLLYRENELEQFDNVDCELYFKIADELYDHDLYHKSLSYYQKGFDHAGSSFVGSSRYFREAYCYSNFEDEPNILRSIECLKVIIDRNDNQELVQLAYYNTGVLYGRLCYLPHLKEDIEKYKDTLFEMIYWITKWIKLERGKTQKDESSYLNCLIWRAWGYYHLTETTSNEKEIEEYRKLSIRNHSIYLDIKEDSQIYQDRSNRYSELGMYEESVRDKVSAEIVNPDPENRERLKTLLDQNPFLIAFSIEYCNNINIETRGCDELRLLLESYSKHPFDGNSGAAATAE